ncbi:MAG: hypothetical protein QNJ63_15225 [Calothrix sp. MO_192.B10]|nr:hypothetical protein [Calothrix sp. MO_192.B10]
MFDDPFKAPIKPPTQFEKDIDDLVETLKREVSKIHDQYTLDPYMHQWIYGNTRHNQEMLIFKKLADLLVQEYSSEGNHKNLDSVVKKWIDDIQLLALKTKNLNEVLKEIESLKSRVS